MDAQRNRMYWQCEGYIEKYHRRCPQRFFFFNPKVTSLSYLQSVIQIKCHRCGKVNGATDDLFLREGGRAA